MPYLKLKSHAREREVNSISLAQYQRILIGEEPDEYNEGKKTFHHDLHLNGYIKLIDTESYSHSSNLI